ncbi:ribonuclease III [Methanobrevibacter sp. OttesenSCG-928-I08]|nr:ribonuclease III [Methanobrevibacter sp. OttesenSCG-928-I08]
MKILNELNIIPNNEKLFKVAFLHSSYSVVHNIDYNYERLEFLGDSVLSLLVAEYLFKKYPDYSEGKLTKLRANFVCRAALIFYSKEIGLNEYLKFSTEDNTLSPQEIQSIYADIFESFLGAIFLDQGIEIAKKFLKKYIFKYIDEEKVFFYDYKSKVKEYADANELTIEYVIIEENGPPHNKTFITELIIDGDYYGKGKGKNKKEAEQYAARKAIEKLEINI